MEPTLNFFPEDNILRKFEEINDFIYANEGLTAQQTLSKFLRILFIKFFDEKYNLGLFKISIDEYKALKLNNKSEAIIRFQKLMDLTKKEYPDVFEKGDTIGLSEKTIGFIINKLQNLNFKDSEGDIKGLAFQKFLSHGEKSGNGQFFTPQPVIDFCVKFINPKPSDKIIDPCCGSGGFLHAAFRNMASGLNKLERHNIINNNIFGIDINKEVCLISKMKFLLEENTCNNILVANSLEDIDILKLELTKEVEFKGFDVLLTNPPFGTAGKISDQAILKNFDLGYKWKITSPSQFEKTSTMLSGQPAEILFIERCLDLLKDGGKMAIVLPNGHFENPSLEYLRFYISKRAKILAIISLPQETFIPYGTGVKTSILFLEKNNKVSDKEKIFFSKITKLGYQGNKNAAPIYKKDKNGDSIIKDDKYQLDEDFSEVIEDYRRFKNNSKLKSNKSYVLPYREIKTRWDYDFYNPTNRTIIENLRNNSVRLGDLVDIVKERSKKLKLKDNQVEYIELSDINTHSFEIINSTSYAVHELPSRATFELCEGDIITGIAGNSVGTRKHATALVTEEYTGCICTNGFRVLRNPKINPYYLLYYFHNDLFLNQMMMYRTGAAIPNVSDQDLSDILVYMPSPEIIEEIGNKMKEFFCMRKESRNIMDSIKNSIPAIN